MTFHDKVTETLKAQKVPSEKAERMAASVRTGAWLLAVGGAILLGDVLGLGWAIVHLGHEPGLALDVAFFLVLALALYFIVAGGNVASGQALDAAAGHSPFFALLAKALRRWRGKA